MLTDSIPWLGEEKLVATIVPPLTKSLPSRLFAPVTTREPFFAT